MVDVVSVDVNPILIFFILLTSIFVIYWVLFGEKKYKDLILKK